MFYFVAIGFLLVGTLLMTGAAKANDGPAVRTALVGVLAMALATLAFSAIKVDHREVAIVTSLGKYDSTISVGGLTLIKPWANAERFDQTIQTVELTDISVSFTDGSDNDELQEIGGGKGLLDGTVRWQISKDQENNGARSLWEKYRTFDAVNSSLVTRASRDAFIDVANDYPAGVAIISQDQIGKKVADKLTEELAPYGIVIDSVSVPAIDLDAGTQAAVDRIFTTQQDIQRAENEQIRAQIDAETVKIREAEGALSPAANQRFCLDLVNNWDVAKNGQLPATFNCNLGGTDPQVIVSSN